VPLACGLAPSTAKRPCGRIPPVPRFAPMSDAAGQRLDPHRSHRSCTLHRRPARRDVQRGAAAAGVCPGRRVQRWRCTVQRLAVTAATPRRGCPQGRIRAIPQPGGQMRLPRCRAGQRRCCGNTGNGWPRLRRSGAATPALPLTGLPLPRYRPIGARMGVPRAALGAGPGRLAADGSDLRPCRSARRVAPTRVGARAVTAGEARSGCSDPRVGGSDRLGQE
jgi:hypothetical protein